MTDYAYEIINLLSPVIGEELAEETVNVQCRKMGIQPEEISSQNIKKFASWIEKVLVIFAGEEIATEIRQQILKL